MKFMYFSIKSAIYSELIEGIRRHLKYQNNQEKSFESKFEKHENFAESYVFLHFSQNYRIVT